MERLQINSAQMNREGQKSFCGGSKYIRLPKVVISNGLGQPKESGLHEVKWLDDKLEGLFFCRPFTKTVKLAESASGHLHYGAHKLLGGSQITSWW
jgi:hypothetical protein